MGDTFKTSDAAAPAGKPPAVNIVIDMGDWDPAHAKVTKEEHDAAVRRINESVDALRKQGIPTIWVAIHNDTVAHPEASRDVVERLKMTELDIKPGEPIFEKRLFSGFTTLQDIENSKVLKDYATGQREDGANYKDAKWGQTTLDDLIKSTGAEHVTIMGAVAQYCVTDNALDAARRGYGVTVLTDAVLGWHDAKTFDKVVLPDDPKVTARQVSETLDNVRADPAARGIGPDEAPAAIAAMNKIELRTVGDFIENSPVLKGNTPASIAESKFAAPAASVVQTSNFIRFGVNDAGAGQEKAPDKTAEAPAKIQKRSAGGPKGPLNP